MMLAPRSFWITVFCLLALSGRIKAQESWLQSLLTKLKTAKNDHERAKIYYSISRYYWNVNMDSALVMGSQSLEIAQRIGDDTSVALAYLTMGVAYGGKGLYPQALDCHLKALRFSEKAGMEGLTGNNFTNIGIVYSGMDEYREAVAYFRRALDISLRDTRDSARVGVATGYINLGDAYWHLSRYDSAISYGRMALPIVSRLADSGYLAVTLSNISRAFSRMGLTDSAMIYAGRARKILIREGDSAGLAETDNTIAEAYRLQGRTMSSMGFAQEAMHLGENAQDHETALDACRILADDDEDLGNYKVAAGYLKKEIVLRDSVFTLAKEKQLRSLQSSYELEKKQHEIALLEKENALRKNKEGRNRDILLILSISLALLGVACFFLYRAMIQKQRLNSLLARKNREVIAQNEELGSLNAVKNKLFSIIGHDLRSPVATLNGFVTLLQAAALTPEKIAWFAGKMQESLSATAYLLDNLLFWAKSQMQGMEVDRTAFDLLPLLEQNRQLAQLRAEGKKIRVELALPADTHELPVVADRNMIDLTVRNLLENAIKFSYEGGTVTLSIRTIDHEVQISVKDGGKGIAEADRAKIGSGTLSFTTMGTGKEKGSGLGLFLCRELIEKNGGKLWFESEEGRGSTFYFTLKGETNGSPG